MPDGQHLSTFAADELLPSMSAGYTPPVALVLEGLDTTELDLGNDRVSVSAKFLRFLIGEIARAMPFDEDFYGQAYPDVEAARLAGDVATLHDHFVTQGYFERRRPHEMPCDPNYYATNYEDLARVFDPRDEETLLSHFRHHGWQEGRVGVAWQRAEADRWVAAARQG
jgi:hypothetical protein